MTLRQIIILTLNNINEDTDDLTVEEYRDSVVRAVNEAYSDICARRYQPRRRVNITIPDDGNIDATSLPADYLQICSIESKDRQPLTFSPRGKSIRVYGYSGSGVLEYIYLPERLSLDIDRPILREKDHYCLADYAAWRQLATGSAARQARGQVFYENYLRTAARINRQGFEHQTITGKFGRGA